MDHYLDIHIQPDPEFSQTTLMGALVSKLHRRLVAMESNDIGISLPGHETVPPLGDVLRIHGNHGRIQTLMETNWLKGMRDHVVLSDIIPVPSNTVHRVVRRRQYKTNVERLRRRRMKRHQESYEEACTHIPDSVERRVSTPYVTVRSQSTGEAFILFIEHGEHCSDPVPGTFGTYGLSNTATIPWF
jgi:CRISPR-associated endonuclease Csy4